MGSGRRTSPRPDTAGSEPLLVIADAAAEVVAGPGYQAHLRNGRLVGARPWKHIADLGDLTFRLLHRRVDFSAKHLACCVLSDPCVRANQLLGVRIANRNNFGVAETS